MWPEKFDIIVANPPYSKKLDLKFLDKCFEICKGELVFVHPSTAFVDTKCKISLFQKINSKIEGKISSIKLFNGNPVFNIGLFVPCSVTHINMNKKRTGFTLENVITGDSSQCQSISRITPYGDRKEFWSIFEKIKTGSNLHDSGNVLGSRQEHKKKLSDPNSIFVEISHIRGNIYIGQDINKGMHKDDFYTLFRRDVTHVSGRNPNYNIWWEFKTEKESENFIKYGKTFFARFCLATSKFSQNLYNGELKSIPWMDFTQEWTDEKLYKHFNITEEEQAFIKEVIPPYYN